MKITTLLLMLVSLLFLWVLGDELKVIEHKIDNNISLSINRDTLINILYPTTGSAKRDYQIECDDDSMVIYDGNKKIGVIDYADDSKLSNLILKDNQ